TAWVFEDCDVSDANASGTEFWNQPLTKLTRASSTNGALPWLANAPRLCISQSSGNPSKLSNPMNLDSGLLNRLAIMLMLRPCATPNSRYSNGTFGPMVDDAKSYNSGCERTIAGALRGQ